MSGVNNLEGALQKVTVVIGDAANGSETARKALANIGLSVEELMAMSPEDQFRAISTAISAIPGQAQQAAAAVDLFGRSGVELLPLFASNIEAVEERAQRLGIVLSGDQTAAIEDMNDALNLVSRTFDGIIGQVTANLAPIVTAIAEEFLSFVEAFEGVGGAGGSGIASALTKGLFEFAKYLATLFDAVILNFGNFATAMSSFVKGLEIAFNLFLGVVETLRGVFNVFEVARDGLLQGLGSFLEGIGSWVSSDLEQFGRALKENAQRDKARNVAEGDAAFANAGAAFTAAVDGGSIAGIQAEGPISAAVQAAFDRFQNAGQGGENPETTGVRNWVKDLARIEEENARKAAQEAERIEKQRLDRILGLNEQYSEKAQDIEANRLDALSRQNQEALQVNDLRSGGISQFLALATGREDPAVAEARAQRKELEKIAAEIRKLGGTVELVGAA